MQLNLTWKLLISVAVGAAAFAAVLLWRSFFFQHALIIGLAVGALTYSALGTRERLSRVHRGRRLTISHEADDSPPAQRPGDQPPGDPSPDEPPPGEPPSDHQPVP